MASERFDCTECGIDFNMRMKLNRHVAKMHKKEEDIDYINNNGLTDEQKEKHFGNLQEKYFELKDKLININQKYEYLKNLLKFLEMKPIANISKPNKLRDFKGHANATGNYEQIPDDPTIPPGWKSAFKTCFVPPHSGVPAAAIKMKVYWAPNGRHCTSRAQALGHMMSNEDQFSKNDIEKMKEGMLADGWKTIKGLPEGWMAMSEWSKVKYTTTGGLLLKNSRTAVKYMLVNCSDEEITNFVKLKFVKDVHTSDITWINSSSIPFRWRVGVVPRNDNICLIILCPDGQVFTGIKPLRDMLAKNETFQIEDLESFLGFLGITKYKAELKAYSWSNAKALPPGWMMRQRENSQHNTVFLSPQGRIFSNRVQVAEFLNVGNEEMKLYPVPSKTSKEWTQDSTLPEGWSFNIGTYGKSFKDPNDQTYTNRVEAIKSIIANSTSTDEVAFMRDSLKDDGWEEVEYLPTGWMLKEKEDLNKKGQGKPVKTKNYLTPNLQILKSFENALVHMKESGESEEQTLQFILQKYTPDDELPKGYFYNAFGGFGNGKSYLNSDGKHFTCMLLLLRHLYNTNHEDLEAAKTVFMKDGYTTSEFLPSDWLIKRVDTKIIYLSPEFKKLKRKQEVINHMEEKKGMEKDIELFKLNFKELRPPPTINSSSFQWSEDPNLPDGWKSAPYNPKLLNIQNKKMCKYLAPDGNFFNSKPAALRHMLGNGDSQDDISKMEAGLVEEGYTSSEFLPKDWRVKTGETWFIFLSPTYVTFSSVNKMKSYMEENNFCEEVIGRVVDNFKWIHQQQSVTNEPISAKRKVEELEDVTENDWEEHYQLPKGWKYRLNFENNPIFLTDSGYKINSLKAAKIQVRSKDMKLDSQTEARVLSNLICFAASFRGSGKPTSPKKLMEKKSKLELTPEIQIEVTETPPKKMEDALEESVPAGWKMAKFSSEHDVILTSPQGKLFLTRRAALEWMVKVQYSKEAITKLCSALHREGWREEARLPAGWRVRSCPEVGESKFLTREMKVLHGVKEAELHLQEGDETELLKSWSLRNGEGRRGEHDWKEDTSLPADWQLSSVKGQTLIKDPRGVVLGSRREAIQLMIREHYSPAHIFKLWSCLDQEGWEEDPSLPTGWKRRTTTFLSPLMEEVVSVAALLHLMSSSHEYREEEVVRARQGLQEEE